MGVLPRFPPFWATVAFVVATVAQIPWRTDTFYSGGADSVVLLKAALTISAVALAGVLAARGPRLRFPAAPTMWFSAYLFITLIGALAVGTTTPSTILAVRVALLAALVVTLLTAYPPIVLLQSLVTALAIIGFTAAGSAIVLKWPSFLVGGRLYGVLPPMHPNDLAAFMAVCAIWWGSRIFRGTDTWFTTVGFLASFGILVLTGSRTSLFVAIAACGVLTLFATRMRLRNAAALALLPGLAAWFIFSTQVVEEAVTRGQASSNVLTLASRTIAWQAAFQPTGSDWHDWFGGGLSQKTVAVSGQWWTEQVLDSSWVSALVQGGYFGFTVVVLWGVSVLVSAARSGRHYRGLWVALTVFLVIRGGLENGLFDSSAAFLCFFLVAHGASPGYLIQDRRPDEESNGSTSAPERSATDDAHDPVALPALW